jgi:hypothetical protein
MQREKQPAVGCPHVRHLTANKNRSEPRRKRENGVGGLAVLCIEADSALMWVSTSLFAEHDLIQNHRRDSGGNSLRNCVCLRCRQRSLRRDMCHRLPLLCLHTLSQREVSGDSDKNWLSLLQTNLLDFQSYELLFVQLFMGIATSVLFCM